MSQFDRHTQSEYVDQLRQFLRMPKRTFLVDAGFIDAESNKNRTGRMTKYDEAPIKALEAKVNEKAARCENKETTLGERIRIARDYRNLQDSDIAANLGVSRQNVACWGDDTYTPSNLTALAELLSVPLDWLEFGPVNTLPANSHLGLRVGDEALKAREQLYSLTIALVGDIPEKKIAKEDYVRSFIEWTIFNNPKFSTAARRAGGRWQFVDSMLFFSPWVPIQEHGLARRDWVDEVETIIQEELASEDNPSVYGAWKNMAARCAALGYQPHEYPKRISLHKRVERERERAERFGIDLNDVVQASVSKVAIKKKK